MKCIRDCMKIIDGKETGFEKGQEITDPDLKALLVDDNNFTGAPVEEKKTSRRSSKKEKPKEGGDE